MERISAHYLLYYYVFDEVDIFGFGKALLRQPMHCYGVLTALLQGLHCIGDIYWPRNSFPLNICMSIGTYTDLNLCQFYTTEWH